MRSFAKRFVALLLMPVFMMFATVDSLYAQQSPKSIRGSVKDTNGLPVVGATVIQSGTNNGVITDKNGAFTLSLVGGKTPAFDVSCIGFQTQTLQIGNRTWFDVILEEEAVKVEEVTVVAYGVQKKETVTGAISSVGTVQVQRGAGLSTNGTGAFGGAVTMSTDALQTVFGGEASLSYGSYNTNKQAIRISSGLMGGHWLVDARLTHIGSDGYIDRGETDLKSYMLQAGYYNGNTMVKVLSFGGKARTGLTYTGATKEEMALNGRRFNPEGMYEVSDGMSWHVWHGDPPEWKDVAYYDDQTDN